MDYTIKNGLGIRVLGQRTCQVIRKVQEEWKEIGPVHKIPVPQIDIAWSDTGIPHTLLSVALRAYEMDHPESSLRDMLTRTRRVGPNPPARVAAAGADLYR